MVAPSKSFVALTDAEIAVQKPLTTGKLTKIRDALVHLKEVVYGNFTPSVAHTHNGIDSALLAIGPNWLRNGNFEDGQANWTFTNYTGGTVATESSNEADGATGLVITSANATNGGGKAESIEYIVVPAGQTRQFWLIAKASAANVPVKAEVIWYDDAKAQISASTIVSTTTTSPTSAVLVVRRIAAPATAKFCRVRFELPPGGAATGSVYFDHGMVTPPHLLNVVVKVSTSNTQPSIWGDCYAWCVAGGGGGGGGGGNGTNPGGDGGDGAVAEGWINYQGEVITIGEGGNGGLTYNGSSSSSGTAGTSSSIGALMSATAGGPGQAWTGTGGADGGDGTPTHAGAQPTARLIPTVTRPSRDKSTSGTGGGWPGRGGNGGVAPNASQYAGGPSGTGENSGSNGNSTYGGGGGARGGCFFFF